MKKQLTLIFILLSIVSVSAQTNSRSSNIRVSTYNIRLETPVDSGARAWSNRKYDIARIIHQCKFDIVGVQEVGSSKQEADLKKLLPEFSYFGKGRDSQDGTKGEQIGILYRADRFEMLQKGSFFLSETPDTISKGWDADFRRLCVWTKFRDRDMNRTLFVFCTHFDHIGKKARVESAALIVSQIKSIAKNAPVILTGDLNSPPEDVMMYNNLTDYLTDASVSAAIKSIPTAGTFNGYDMKTNDFPAQQKIDYIFTRKFKVLNYRVINVKYNDFSYSSDHFPLMCECGW